MKMILFNVTANKWTIGTEKLTAAELHKKYGIANPVLYCQRYARSLTTG